MPIKDLQKRLTTVGAIRLGERRTAANGKEYPSKLLTLRITSPDAALIDAAAAKYGGKPRPWESAPGGPQFQVVTEATDIFVYVPRQTIDPNLELWGDRVKRRHCDGETEKLRQVPCLCLQGCRLPGGVHNFAADMLNRGTCPCGVKRACLPTTRVSLILGEIPWPGTLKLESHGWNAAAELPGFAEYIAVATEHLPGRLRLDKRESARIKPDEEGIEPRSFVVPVLDFGGMFSAHQAAIGQLSAAARQAVGAPPREAITAGPARVLLTEESVLRSAKHLRNPEQLRDLWRRASADGALTEKVAAVLAASAAELEETAAQRNRPAAAPAPAPRPAAGGADDVVDAEIVDEPEEGTRIRALWAQIVDLAGALGWNMATLAEKFTAHAGYDHRDDSKAKVADFEVFRNLLRVELAGQQASHNKRAR